MVAMKMRGRCPPIPNGNGFSVRGGVGQFPSGKIENDAEELVLI
jgi:hypothetical protein